MRVELLHHAGCRSAQPALELVRECLVALAIPVPVLVRVGDYPSPTVLIDGVDVMNPASEQSEVSVCRVDVPTRERVFAALTAHPTANALDEISASSEPHHFRGRALDERCRGQ